MTELLCKNEVYALIGAAMEVYNQLGPGFLEAVYQEALEHEFRLRGIPFQPQPELPLIYKEHRLKKYYVADFIAYNQVVIEIKAQDRLTSIDESQLLNELKASGCEVGLLVNFGHPSKLDWKRRVMTQKGKADV